MGPVARKGEARDGSGRAGFGPVQLRFATQLTGQQYVEQKAWLTANLERCPLHPAGGCHFSRHTPYERVEPPGTFIARWYCPEGHTTFSLLPDFLASRLSSTLEEVEAVASKMERSEQSFEQQAQRLRPDIEPQGAVRWARRRVAAVLVALLAIKGLQPQVLTGAAPTLGSLRQALGVEQVLPALRELAGRQVVWVPHPVGLGPRSRGRQSGQGPRQQEPGADSSRLRR